MNKTKLFIMICLGFFNLMYSSEGEKINLKNNPKEAIANQTKLPNELVDVLNDYLDNERLLAQILGVPYPLYQRDSKELIKPATILGIKDLGDIAQAYRDKVYPGGRPADFFSYQELSVFNKRLNPAIKEKLNEEIKKIYDQAKLQLEKIAEKRENEARSKPRSLAEPLEIDYTID